MSEPVEETGAPPATTEPAAETPLPFIRRFSTPALTAAGAIVLVVIVLAATPFWAPAIMTLLPWGRQPATVETAKPSPRVAPAPEPGSAVAQAQASQNAAALQLLAQRVAALETRPAPAPPADLGPIERQLGALAKTAADLGESVAALEKAAQTRPAADPSNTAAALVLLQIGEAVEVGRPFDAEYRALTALVRDHPEIAAAAAPLAGPAESGVASRAVLAARLLQLAPEIATAKPPPKASWKSQVVAQLRSLVTIRRIDDGAGQTAAEAAVGAAQRAMASGDLPGAVAALDGLEGANLAVAQPWLQMAKARLAVEAALRQTEAALAAALGNPAVVGKD